MSTIIKDDNTQSVNTPNATDRVTTRGTVNKRLRFLDQLADYKVHHDDIDIRGYSVVLAGGETIGEVEGLLADTTAELVRYVEVEIEDDVIGRHTAGRYTDEDKHALVPIGLVRIDASSNTITLMGLSFDHLVDYPRYRRDHGYTTGYEIDTNDYLADFHEHGSSYDRNRFSTAEHRSADTLDDAFYTSGFYTKTY